MSPASSVATERILRLAAYVAEKGAGDGGLTLTDIVDGVPDYDGTAAPRDDHGDIATNTAEWEALRKKVTRDIADLREYWGIVVEYDDAAHRYRLAGPFFTPAERASLLAAAGLVLVEGAPPVGTGELGAQLDDARAVVVMRLHRLVEVLRAAIHDACLVRFTYDDRERVVEPWALGIWRNRWYLAARDPLVEGLRRFRLDRVEGAVEAVGDTGAFTVPDDFDLDAAFDLDPNSWGADPPVTAVLRVAHDHVESVVAEFAADVLSTDDDWGRVTFEVRDYESFVWRLLAFRGAAVVEEPPVLVDRVRDHLTALVEGGGAQAGGA